MGEWINIEERLPDNGQEVIIYAPDGGVMGAFFRTWTHVRTGQLMQAFQDYDNEIFNWWTWEVTHWQPLPEPPQ
jgi:Protein of unknown function (DUF551).